MKISCTNQTLVRSTLTGILFTVLLGSLLHFTYEWSGHLTAVSLFSAVNESTWEHLKLLFMPMFLYSAAETLLLGRCFPGLMKARAFGCIAGMFIITALFYTYTGIIGRNYLPIDIAVFLIGAAAAFLLSTRTVKPRTWQAGQKKRPDDKTSSLGGLAVFLLLFFFFVWFTAYPPRLGIFQPPA